MKTIFLLSASVFFAFAGFVQDTVRGQEIPVDTIRKEPVKVDTIWVEKVKVEPQQPQVQQPVSKDQKSNKKKDKAYYGGYANLSFGQYTLFGFEPLIGYRLLPKFSVERN